MTIAPDTPDIEELDFPTPEIEEAAQDPAAQGFIEPASFSDVVATVQDVVAAMASIPQERITVGPIHFTSNPVLPPGPFICWDCDSEFSGPVGRCPNCADAFAHRMATMAPAVTEEEISTDWMPEVHRRMREAEQRRIRERDWYCYCSPTRRQMLAPRNDRYAPYYTPYAGGGGGRGPGPTFITPKMRSDWNTAWTLSGGRGDEAFQALLDEPADMYQAMGLAEYSQDVTGGGWNWPPRWLGAVVGLGVGLALGILLALLA